MKTKTSNEPELVWNCHAGNHEVGCPCKSWTNKQLQEALEAKKREEANLVDQFLSQPPTWKVPVERDPLPTEEVCQCGHNESYHTHGHGACCFYGCECGCLTFTPRKVERCGTCGHRKDFHEVLDITHNCLEDDDCNCSKFTPSPKRVEKTEPLPRVEELEGKYLTESVPVRVAAIWSKTNALIRLSNRQSEIINQLVEGRR